MRKLLSLALACGLVLGACQSGKESAGGQKQEGGQQAATQRVEPDYIVVQHILIGFQGSLPGKPVSRTREEAGTLAEEILKRAKGGEDFDALVRQYTDDQAPGIYAMANNGVAPKPGVQMFQRGGMVKGFGDVGFSLDVGQIGMCGYDAKESPYGWHIVKRIE